MGSLLKNINGGRELPRYQSHKIVWALKIKLVVPELKGQATIYPADEGYEPFLASQEYVRKHQPTSGGYYVVYADGYESWSPQVAFEDGNSPIDAVVIDGKYKAELRINPKYSAKLDHEAARIVLFNNASGEEIPADEPKVLFRARDPLLMGVLEKYLADCTKEGAPAKHIAGVTKLIEECAGFARKHPERMKKAENLGIPPAPYKKATTKE